MARARTGASPPGLSELAPPSIQISDAARPGPGLQCADGVVQLPGGLVARRGRPLAGGRLLVRRDDLALPRRDVLEQRF